jgi:hypothetical protein
MDDTGYAVEEDLRTHTALERHLAIGAHIYQFTAAVTGEEQITLSATGWDTQGEVVSELSGGISPDDLPAVTEALTATLSSLAVLRQQRQPAPAVPVPGRRHPNQGVRWSAEDDERLAARFGEGAKDRELMEELGRSRGGIKSRLEYLGLITADGRPVAQEAA